MNKERGDFAWKGDEIIWVPSDKGKIIFHPVLGPLPFDSILVNCIIGKGLAEEINKSLLEELGYDKPIKGFIHPEEGVLYTLTCEVCGKSFSSNEAFPKPHTCPSCYI